MLFALLISGFALQTSTVPEPAQDAIQQPTETFIRIDTPTWSGEFDLHLVQLPQESAVMVKLTGTIDDVHLGQEYNQKASITFVYPVDHNKVIDIEAGRIVKNNKNTEIFKVEKLAPEAELWTSVKMPQLGTLQIWKTKVASISDSVIVSLFDDLIVMDETSLNIQGVQCDPTWQKCNDDAKASCSPNRVGGVSYTCTAESVSCSFTCLSSPPS